MASLGGPDEPPPAAPSAKALRHHGGGQQAAAAAAQASGVAQARAPAAQPPQPPPSQQQLQLKAAPALAPQPLSPLDRPGAVGAPHAPELVRRRPGPALATPNPHSPRPPLAPHGTPRPHPRPAPPPPRPQLQHVQGPVLARIRELGEQYIQLQVSVCAPPLRNCSSAPPTSSLPPRPPAPLPVERHPPPHSSSSPPPFQVGAVCGPLIVCFGGDFLSDDTARVVGDLAQAGMALSRALEQLRINSSLKLLQAKARVGAGGPVRRLG